MNNDTKILDEVLNMLATNEIVDWIGNDPVKEFQAIGKWVVEKRAAALKEGAEDE